MSEISYEIAFLFKSLYETTKLLKKAVEGIKKNMI